MEEISLKQALDILKNRNRALEVNHLIGSREIANQELKEICESNDKFVIPTFEKALEENTRLKSSINIDKILLKDLETLVEDLRNENEELKEKVRMHDFFWEGCGFEKKGFKSSIQVRNYVEKLEKENEELKTQMKSKVNIEELKGYE